MIALKRSLVIVVSLLLGSAAIAQTHLIKGRVTDESQEPLAGASVSVLNSTRGEITDVNGNYEIRAAEGETLVFSFLGFETKNVTVDSRAVINVTLAQETNALNELVVVGYGVQKKVNVTGAVASVDYANEVKSRPVTSTAQVLQGVSPGVQVNQASGQPGSEDVTIRVRGIGTLNAASPLIIVDGFEGTIANVNPDDILSVSILKDAASCAIYGNRGANGVVLVTTKTGGEGEKGKFSISYNGMLALNEPASKFEVISNYADYMSIINESADNIGATAPFSQAMIDLWREKEKDPNGIADSGYPNYVAYPNTDWMDAIYKKGIYHKHNISANGSSGGTKYLISMSYIDNPGVIDNTGSRKFQLRTNVSSQVTKWLEIGTKIWGYESNTEVSDTYFGLMSRAVPGIYPYYDGKYGWMENPEQASDSRNNLYFFNRMGGGTKTHYVNAIAFANVKLPLDIRYNASFNYSRTGSESRTNRKILNAFSFREGKDAYIYDNLDNLTLTRKYRQAYRWTFQNNLSWARTIAKKHDISAMLGFEAMYSNEINEGLTKKRLDNDQLTELNNALDVDPKDVTGAQTDFASASVFGRVTYAYDSRYLFEANLRYDGSSRFARQSRWGLFDFCRMAHQRGAVHEELRHRQPQAARIVGKARK